MSHPTWVRGLKPLLSSGSMRVIKVAPYVGAWIETSQMSSVGQSSMSHPTWVRGLKHLFLLVIYRTA